MTTLLALDDSVSYAEVYTSESCPWCIKAKILLEQFGIPYAEKEGPHPSYATVPFIIINDKAIGGFLELRRYLSEL